MCWLKMIFECCDWGLKASQSPDKIEVVLNTAWNKEKSPEKEGSKYTKMSEKNIFHFKFGWMYDISF